MTPPGGKTSIGWKLDVDTGPLPKLTFTAMDGTGKTTNISAGGAAQPEDFTNWILVYNGETSTISIFRDGKLVREASAAGPLSLYPPCGTTLVSSGKTGICLDDWTIWDRPLSPYEVAAYHTGHLNLPTPTPADAAVAGALPAGLVGSLLDNWTFESADGSWLANTKRAGNPAYFAGSAHRVGSYFGSALLIESGGTNDEKSDGMLLLPDFRGPLASGNLLDSMTVAFWAGQPVKGEGVLCLDHSVKGNGAMVGGWILTIDPNNPFKPAGAKASIQFEAVAAGGQPFTVSASLPGEQPLGHWAVTYDHVFNVVKLFCDGIKVAEKEVPADGLVAGPPTANIYVQRENRAVWLDELSRWNRALSKTELAALVRAGTIPATRASGPEILRFAMADARKTIRGDLRDYWPFDEGEGQQLNDLIRPGSAALTRGNAGWSDGVAGSALRLSAADPATGVPAGSLVFAQFQKPPAAGSSVTLSMRLKCLNPGQDFHCASLLVGRAVTGQWNRLLKGWRVGVSGDRKRSQIQVFVEAPGPDGKVIKLSRKFPWTDAYRQIGLVFNHETGLLTVYYDGLEAVKLPVDDSGFDLASLYPDISVYGKTGAFALDELAIWPRALSPREILLMKDCAPLCDAATLARLKHRAVSIGESGRLKLADSLVNCWRFDEKNGQRSRDDKGDDVAYFDGMVNWVDGHSGAALELYDKKAAGGNR